METRVAELGRADKEKRTAPLTLSTETPVDRGSFFEVLDHRPGGADLSRAPLPLIVGHDALSLPLGVVESLELKGGRLRGIARFGSSPEAQQLFDDVVDGIVRGVSIAYEYLSSGELIADDTYRFKFRPLEVSALAVPADPSAGFFRSKDLNTMQTQDETLSRRERALAEKVHEQNMFNSVPDEDREEFRGYIEALGFEYQLPPQSVVRSMRGVDNAYITWRESAIRKMAESWNNVIDPQQLKARVAEAVSDGSTLTAFRKEMKEMLNRVSARVPETMTGQLEADNPGYQSGARVHDRYSNLRHFQGKDAEARAHQAGMFFRSLAGDNAAASWCRDRGLVGQRNLGTGVFAAGGAVLPGPLVAEVINLVEKYGVFRRFARTWPMESATIAIPVKTAGVSVAAVGESTATPTSDPAFTNINLTAKEFAGGTRVHRNLLEDSPVALGDFIVGEFGLALAEKEDRCGFLGDGTSTYGGMKGIKTLLEDGSHNGGKVDAASAHDTFAEIDAADLSKLMAACPEYARSGAAWYLSATAKDSILTRLMIGAGGNNTQTLQGGVGESFLGYPVRTSQVLPADASATYNGSAIIFFGNLAQSSAFGDRRGMQVDIDVSRFVEYREIFFQVTERFDIVNSHVGTSTVAGPIVGLFGKT